MQQEAKKCLTNVAVIEKYGIGTGMVKDYHNTLQKSSDQLRKLPPPPNVRLNCNILDVQKSLSEVCTRLYCTQGLISVSIIHMERVLKRNLHSF